MVEIEVYDSKLTKRLVSLGMPCQNYGQDHDEFVLPASFLATLPEKGWAARNTTPNATNKESRMEKPQVIHECEIILVCFRTKKVIARHKVVNETAAA